MSMDLFNFEDFKILANFLIKVKKESDFQDQKLGVIAKLSSFPLRLIFTSVKSLSNMHEELFQMMVPQELDSCVKSFQEVGEEYRCKLSGRKLFSPVSLQGVIYERFEIEKHINLRGYIDPVTGDDLNERRLLPCKREWRREKVFKRAVKLAELTVKYLPHAPRCEGSIVKKLLDVFKEGNEAIPPAGLSARRWFHLQDDAYRMFFSTRTEIEGVTKNDFLIDVEKGKFWHLYLCTPDKEKLLDIYSKSLRVSVEGTEEEIDYLLAMTAKNMDTPLPERLVVCLRNVGTRKSRALAAVLQKRIPKLESKEEISDMDEKEEGFDSRTFSPPERTVSLFKQEFESKQFEKAQTRVLNLARSETTSIDHDASLYNIFQYLVSTVNENEKRQQERDVVLKKLKGKANELEHRTNYFEHLCKEREKEHSFFRGLLSDLEADILSDDMNNDIELDEKREPVDTSVASKGFTYKETEKKPSAKVEKETDKDYLEKYFGNFKDDSSIKKGKMYYFDEKEQDALLDKIVDEEFYDEYLDQHVPTHDEKRELFARNFNDDVGNSAWDVSARRFSRNNRARGRRGRGPVVGGVVKHFNQRNQKHARRGDRNYSSVVRGRENETPWRGKGGGYNRRSFEEDRRKERSYDVGNEKAAWGKQKRKKEERDKPPRKLKKEKEVRDDRDFANVVRGGEEKSIIVPAPIIEMEPTIERDYARVVREEETSSWDVEPIEPSVKETEEEIIADQEKENEENEVYVDEPSKRETVDDDSSDSDDDLDSDTDSDSDDDMEVDVKKTVLFLSHLPTSTNLKELVGYCYSGEIKPVRILFVKSLGIAFVKFEKGNDALKISQRNYKIKGVLVAADMHMIEVYSFVKTALSKGTKRVQILNMDISSTLKPHFVDIGGIVKIDVKFPPLTDDGKVFAMIEFENTNLVVEAICKRHDSLLGHNRIVVKNYTIDDEEESEPIEFVEVEKEEIAQIMKVIERNTAAEMLKKKSQPLSGSVEKIESKEVEDETKARSWPSFYKTNKSRTTEESGWMDDNGEDITFNAKPEEDISRTAIGPSSKKSRTTLVESGWMDQSWDINREKITFNDNSKRDMPRKAISPTLLMMKDVPNDAEDFDFVEIMGNYLTMFSIPFKGVRRSGRNIVVELEHPRYVPCVLNFEDPCSVEGKDIFPTVCAYEFNCFRQPVSRTDGEIEHKIVVSNLPLIYNHREVKNIFKRDKLVIFDLVNDGEKVTIEFDSERSVRMALRRDGIIFKDMALKVERY